MTVISIPFNFYYTDLMVSGKNSEVPTKIFYSKNQAQSATLTSDLSFDIIKVIKDESLSDRAVLYIPEYKRLSLNFNNSTFTSWDNFDLSFLSYEGAIVFLSKNPTEAH